MRIDFPSPGCWVCFIDSQLTDFVGWVDSTTQMWAAYDARTDVYSVYVDDLIEIYLDSGRIDITRRKSNVTPEPLPEIPAECHNTRPIDPERCREATRAMCGEGK